MSKEIILNRGVAIVDDEDYDCIVGFRWTATENSTNAVYARTIIGGRTIYMHRMVLREPSSHIDHINGNALDNRKENLRLCTRRQNNSNAVVRTGRRLKGVYPRNGRFMALIQVDYRPINLGRFQSEDEAAHAYNKAAVLFHGDFA